MRGQRQSKSETQASPPANADTNDVERGNISPSASSGPPAYDAAPTPPSSFISNVANKVASGLTTLPFGTGSVFQMVIQEGAAVVAGELLTLIIIAGVGSAILAPVFAAASCLGNVTGSWVMRLHHSHEAFAFYDGSVQGNYAIAGALLAVPYATTHVILLSLLGYGDVFFFFSVVHCILAPLPYAAAAGAIAAAIGAARGFDMQTITNSTIANVAGSGFIQALALALVLATSTICSC